jgi:hypothetical protein
MTANARWEEIERELLPGQTAYDRPDLVARVFEERSARLYFPHAGVILFYGGVASSSNFPLG